MSPAKWRQVIVTLMRVPSIERRYAIIRASQRPATWEELGLGR